MISQQLCMLATVLISKACCTVPPVHRMRMCCGGCQSCCKRACVCAFQYYLRLYKTAVSLSLLAGILELEPSMTWNPQVVAGIGAVTDPTQLHKDMHGYLAGLPYPFPHPCLSPSSQSINESLCPRLCPQSNVAPGDRHVAYIRLSCMHLEEPSCCSFGLSLHALHPPACAVS